MNITERIEDNLERYVDERGLTRYRLKGDTIRSDCYFHLHFGFPPPKDLSPSQKPCMMEAEWVPMRNNNKGRAR